MRTESNYPGRIINGEGIILDKDAVKKIHNCVAPRKKYVFLNLNFILSRQNQSHDDILAKLWELSSFLTPLNKNLNKLWATAVQHGNLGLRTNKACFVLNTDASSPDSQALCYRIKNRAARKSYAQCSPVAKL